MTTDRRGLHLSDMPKTVCGALICFVASPFCSRPTGCSWSWTNLPGASLALACTQVMSMVWPCVECSTQLFQPRVFRSISALTTIRYSSITNGKRILTSWMSMKSKPFPRGEHCLPVFLQFDDDPAPGSRLMKNRWKDRPLARISGSTNYREGQSASDN